MAYKVISSTSNSGLVYVADTETDLDNILQEVKQVNNGRNNSLGVVAIVLDPYMIYALDSTDEWKEVATGGGGGDVTDAIKYTEQTLTEEQQMQARKNLDLYRSEIETTQLIPEATVHYDSITNPPDFPLESLPEEGQIIRCTFNATNYVTPVVSIAGEILAIGNQRIADPDLPDTGEPFFGMFGSQSDIGAGMNLLLPEGTEDVDVTFGADLLNETIYKVPEQYLPDEVATKEYVDEANEIFVANYNETTLEELREAILAGKFVVCKKDADRYVLGSYQIPTPGGSSLEVYNFYQMYYNDFSEKAEFCWAKNDNINGWFSWSKTLANDA